MDEPDSGISINVAVKRRHSKDDILHENVTFEPNPSKFTIENVAATTKPANATSLNNVETAEKHQIVTKNVDIPTTRSEITTCLVKQPPTIITPQTSSINLDSAENNCCPEEAKNFKRNNILSSDYDFVEKDDVDNILYLDVKSKTARDEGTVPQNEKRSKAIGWSMLFLVQCLLQIALVASFIVYNQASTKLTTRWNDNDDCIYVPGGGFSGFWSSMGRLRSINDPSTKNFLCYSSGCLGAVAALTSYTREQLIDMAISIQDGWKNGTVWQYDVVELFIDELLSDQTLRNEPSHLSSLNIITSIPDPAFGFHAEIHKPMDFIQLKTLLLQTTWIPHATASHFSHLGHLDGGFSSLQHPSCKNAIGLTRDKDIVLNTLNVNLNRDLALEFWDRGLEIGV